MKKHELLAVLPTALLTLSSCFGGGGQQPVASDTDSTDVANVLSDSTVFGLCGDGSAMNTLQLITDAGDTLNLSTIDAQEAGQVFGGYQTGDRMAVMLNGDKTAATIVINQSALLGNWTMPNPIDGSSEVGISIKEGGIAESIEQSSIVYQTWRIHNGRLEIQSVREGGGDMEEVGVYQLVLLAPDSLVYKDAEDTFEYGRQRPKENYGTNIELEEASDFDYRI